MKNSIDTIGNRTRARNMLRICEIFVCTDTCFCVRYVYGYIMLEFYDVLLTVHLSIFILVVNQLDAQNLF